MTTNMRTGLTPTRDLAAARDDLKTHGACVVLDALDTAMLTEVRTALYRAADSDRVYRMAEAYAFGRDDHLNQRVWNLPSRDPVFWALAEHPVAMYFVQALLGWPALLSSMSANITAGGGQSMVLHCDQGYMPQPWTRAHGVNIGWCVDDFAADNGATLYIPNSQHWNGEAHDQIDIYRDRLVPIEAPAGSALVMDGRLMHTNGVNTSERRRAGIFGFYTLPVYLPQENWSLSANPAIRQFGSETLQTLLGFRPQLLGRINGRDRL